eukprot:1136428-Pelagomonas_calceolata.AAC.2
MHPPAHAHTRNLAQVLGRLERHLDPMKAFQQFGDGYNYTNLVAAATLATAATPPPPAPRPAAPVLPPLGSRPPFVPGQRGWPAPMLLPLGSRPPFVPGQVCACVCMGGCWGCSTHVAALGLLVPLRGRAGVFVRVCVHMSYEFA